MKSRHTGRLLLRQRSIGIRLALVPQILAALLLARRLGDLFFGGSPGRAAALIAIKGEAARTGPRRGRRRSHADGVHGGDEVVVLGVVVVVTTG